MLIGATRIVILEIDRLTHARRSLIDKTKYALVEAAPVFVHQRLPELHAEIFVVVFLDL